MSADLVQGLANPYALVIVRTPLRMSFFGGGTDYPDYYLRHGGEVLATSIDKYCYVIFNRMLELGTTRDRFRLHYARREAVQSVEEIEHPMVRACFAHYGMENPVTVIYSGDLPARSGLGSSSSFTVGLIHGVHAFHQRLRSKEELALEAIDLEQNVMQERVGSQDQYVCAVGGLRHVRFRTDGSIDSDLIRLSPERVADLEGRLMMFFTGLSRVASEVLEEQLERTRTGSLDEDLEELSGLVGEARAILESDADLDAFGDLLHRGWEIKKRLSSRISSTHIDDIYDRARAAGALGGKLLGAGSGGFLLLYVPPDRRAAVQEALVARGLVDVPVGLENSGTTLLYVH